MRATSRQRIWPRTSPPRSPIGTTTREPNSRLCLAASLARLCGPGNQRSLAGHDDQVQKSRRPWNGRPFQCDLPDVMADPRHSDCGLARSVNSCRYLLRCQSANRPGYRLSGQTAPVPVANRLARTHASPRRFKKASDHLVSTGGRCVSGCGLTKDR